jgi:hypothetical protein
MRALEETQPTRAGVWLYAGEVPCEVRIVRHHTLYGTGDYEDPPEVACDREIDCFYVLYHTPVGEPAWVGGGVALSLEEAVSLAERMLGSSLQWSDP